MRTLRRRTRWLLVVAAVLVLAAVAGTTVLVRAAGRDSTVASGCDLPETAPAASAAPAATAPGGGGVRVVQSAWSPTSSDAGVSMAAIVRNTSTTQVAYRTVVTFAATTADGKPATNAEAARSLVLEVPVLLPGQRLGVGNWAGLAVDDLGEVTAAPAAMTVTLGDTHWVDADDQRFQNVTAAYQGINRTKPDKPSRGWARVQVDSPYCREVARHGVALLFRDSTGRLVGGTRIVDGFLSACRPGSRTDSDSSREIQGIPDNADLGRTEAYPYCDTAAVDPRPTERVGHNYA